MPLVSSGRAVKALERLGFQKARSSGSHQTMHRKRDDGGTDVLVITLGKREIPRNTLRAALRQGKVSVDEFIAALR